MSDINPRERCLKYEKKIRKLIGNINFRNLVFRSDNHDVSDHLFSCFFRLLPSTGMLIADFLSSLVVLLLEGHFLLSQCLSV